MEMTEKQIELFNQFDELVDLMIDNGFELDINIEKPECLSMIPIPKFFLKNTHQLKGRMSVNMRLVER